MNTTTYADNNQIVAQPAGFNRPVVIRRSVTKTGQVRFHYWGQALRWLPISADLAIAALAEVAA